MRMFSLPVRFSSTAAYCPASPMIRRTVSASFTTSSPEDGGPARVGAQNGGEDAHGGRLAGAVGAEQPEDRPLLDGERHPVERAHVALGEDLDEVVRLHGIGGITAHFERNLVIKLFPCQGNGPAPI